jgi:hypothetical protein
MGSEAGGCPLPPPRTTACRSVLPVWCPATDLPPRGCRREGVGPSLTPLPPHAHVHVQLKDAERAIWVSRMLDFKSANHHSPVTLAAGRGDVNVLQLLLANGGSPNQSVWSAHCEGWSVCPLHGGRVCRHSFRGCGGRYCCSLHHRAFDLFMCRMPNAVCVPRCTRRMARRELLPSCCRPCGGSG